MLSAELLLHLDVVEAQTILPGDLVRVRKVIDALVLVEPFVQVSFAAARRPQQVPLMRLGEGKAIGFTDASDELGVALQNLVEQLAVVDVVATWPALVVAEGLCGRSIHQQLVLFDIFEIDGFVDRSFFNR